MCPNPLFVGFLAQVRQDVYVSWMKRALDEFPAHVVAFWPISKDDRIRGQVESKPCAPSTTTHINVVVCAWCTLVLPPCGRKKIREKDEDKYGAAHSVSHCAGHASRGNRAVGARPSLWLERVGADAPSGAWPAAAARCSARHQPSSVARVGELGSQPKPNFPQFKYCCPIKRAGRRHARPSESDLGKPCRKSQKTEARTFGRINMILKIKLGGGARGLLNYISQTSKTTHTHTRPFFSNMAGRTPRELAAEVAALRRLKPNLGKAVAHLSLSSDPADRPLTDEEWKAAVTTALAGHGASQAAFCAYRHQDTEHDHTHVFFTGPK